MWWTPDLSGPALRRAKTPPPSGSLTGLYVALARHLSPGPLPRVDNYAGPHLEEHRGGEARKLTTPKYLWVHLGSLRGPLRWHS